MDLRRFEVTGVEDLHPEVILEELGPHGQTAQLVVPDLEDPLLLHPVPVVPGTLKMKTIQLKQNSFEVDYSFTC